MRSSAKLRKPQIWPTFKFSQTLNLHFKGNNIHIWPNLNSASFIFGQTDIWPTTNLADPQIDQNLKISQIWPTANLSNCQFCRLQI
jgi:hypothetical protein